MTPWSAARPWSAIERSIISTDNVAFIARSQPRMCAGTARVHECIVPSCIDDRKMKRIGHPNTMAGLKNIVVIWTVFVALVDISYVATWTERSRCENSLVLKLNVGPYARRMTNREDFPQASRAFGALHRQQGRVNLYTLKKKERDRQRPFDEKLRSDL